MGKWGKAPESLCLVAGVFLVWNEEESHGYRRRMMTVLDKIKSFFKRAKPLEVTGEKPPEVAEEKPPNAPREKLGKTTKPQKKAPKATRKKAPRPSQAEKSRLELSVYIRSISREAEDLT